ncbi:MAG: radical SAM protein, partial [Clostridia bacterium]|nr:radical SAM protein [Clostridia bacterium]
MKLSQKAVSLGVKTAFDYSQKDPEKNLPKLLQWVDRLAGDGPYSFQPQRDVFRTIINDPENCMHKLVYSLFTDIDPDVLQTVFENFVINASFIGWPREEELRAKYNCNIPWAILLDPTSACNLHCTGCWAAEYGNRLNLSFDEIDSIITQGKELG